ncbi:RmlC-like cupin [Calocera viscosa TUFC12733]|uniref:RmlC-like cupin n=1 Tax=Calocera viscosa (strain TUFC12733) TaxID=1330018 RepID=A0A167PEJ0_CALVF|nr:RmlC-like cupin [Calocera viscosa TUFC12733]
MPSWATLLLTLLAASLSATQAAPTRRDSQLSLAETIKALRDAPMAINRANILDYPGGYQFDFLNAKNSGLGKDGPFILADNGNFHAVIGNGMSMFMAFIGPCGMVPSHTHPRATELELIVAGGPMLTGIMTEAGGPYTVGYGNVTFFPLGSIHFQQNLGCDPAVLVAILNSENPGFSVISNTYFGLGNETVAASLGQAEETIPMAINLGQESCLQRCGIDRDTYDISAWSKLDFIRAAYKTVVDQH